MKKFILVFSFCTLLAATIGAYLFLSTPKGSLQFLDEQGQVVILPKNAKIYLHFWGTWCKPCLMEMPELDQYAGRKSDISIYAVHVGKQSVSDIRMVYDQLKIKNLKIYYDPNGALASHFQVNAFPSTLEITENLKEIKRYTGPQQWQYFE